MKNIFSDPRHPYTKALLSALPERNINASRLPTIPGLVPGKFDRPGGCLFHPRCKFAKEKCKTTPPALIREGDSTVRCHFPLLNGVADNE